jgi:hypothetical protein
METQHVDNSKIFTSIDDIINYYTHGLEQSENQKNDLEERKNK